MLAIPNTDFHTSAPITAPTMGATQKSQSWPSAPPSANTAVPVERAGLTDAPETGSAPRWITVSARPIASGAKPGAAFGLVTARMMKMKSRMKAPARWPASAILRLRSMPSGVISVRRTFRSCSR